MTINHAKKLILRKKELLFTTICILPDCQKRSLDRFWVDWLAYAETILYQPNNGF